jgi:hypothetical protein
VSAGRLLSARTPTSVTSRQATRSRDVSAVQLPTTARVTRLASSQRRPPGTLNSATLGIAPQDRSIVNTDVVLWYTFGHTHVPRAEDYPVSESWVTVRVGVGVRLQASVTVASAMARWRVERETRVGCVCELQSTLSPTLNPNAGDARGCHWLPIEA